MILGGRHYLGNYGYSMFTFRSKTPTGPFRPDCQAFRLNGNSHDLKKHGYRDRRANDIGVQGLAAFARGKDNEILISNYGPSQYNGDNEDIVLMPLRKAVTDDQGHLRLAYWPGNDAVKAGVIPFKSLRCDITFPQKPDEHRSVEAGSNFLKLTDAPLALQPGARGGVLALGDKPLDLAKGFVLEGSLVVQEDCCGAGTHTNQVFAGIYFEEQPGYGKAIIMETYGTTRIDRLDFRNGRLSFETEDITGPGCATIGGIHAGRTYSFRLLARHDIFELYLDDLLVQTFFISNQSTGRLGFLCRDGVCLFENLKLYQMSL